MDPEIFVLLPDRRRILLRLSHKDLPGLVDNINGKYAGVMAAYEQKYGGPLKYEPTQGPGAGLEATKSYAWRLQQEIMGVLDLSVNGPHSGLFASVGISDIPSCGDPAVIDWLHYPTFKACLAMSDADIMERFHHVYKDVVRRSRESRLWWVYDGRRWRLDDDDTMLRWFVNVMQYYKEDAEADVTRIREELKEKGEEKTSPELKDAEARLKAFSNANKVNYITSLIEKGLVNYGRERGEKSRRGGGSNGF